MTTGLKIAIMVIQPRTHGRFCYDHSIAELFLPEDIWCVLESCSLLLMVKSSVSAVVDVHSSYSVIVGSSRKAGRLKLVAPLLSFHAYQKILLGVLCKNRDFNDCFTHINITALPIKAAV